jgi:signal transduction histidine kinase
MITLGKTQNFPPKTSQLYFAKNKMRPIQESAVSLKDFAGLFIALAAVALAAIMLFDVTSRQEDADERISHSRAVYNDSQQLLLDCERLNNTVQSYVLTKQVKFLPRYKASKAAMERNLAALVDTTRTASVKIMMQNDLAPSLKNYLNACDQLIMAASVKVADGATVGGKATAGKLADGISTDGKSTDGHTAGGKATAGKSTADKSNNGKSINSKIDDTLLVANNATNAKSAESEFQIALKSQGWAADDFKISLDSVRAAQANVLDARKDKMAALSERIDQTRIAILLVAFIAILSSIFTLRTVMKKDKEKIESLQEAVARTQEAQLTASEALAQAQKSNELKSKFMATISHEIRTPMTGILGMADLLCANNLEQPDKQYAEVLFQSSKELLVVLNDLLNFSHLEQNDLVVERKPFAIRQTIKDVTGLAEGVARDKHLSLTTVIDKRVPQLVQGDEEKIKRVIATLVSNSLKFTAEGGVQISVEPAENNSLKIAVIDTGIGINREDQGRVFQPFFQVDGGIRRKFGGTGLSLTIAKHIVERMAGKIGVLSEPGSGSIFWFTLTGVIEND